MERKDCYSILPLPFPFVSFFSFFFFSFLFFLFFFGLTWWLDMDGSRDTKTFGYYSRYSQSSIQRRLLWPHTYCKQSTLWMQRRCRQSSDFFFFAVFTKYGKSTVVQGGAQGGGRRGKIMKYRFSAHDAKKCGFFVVFFSCLCFIRHHPVCTAAAWSMLHSTHPPAATFHVKTLLSQPRTPFVLLREEDDGCFPWKNNRKENEKNVRIWSFLPKWNVKKTTWRKRMTHFCASN